MSDPVTPDALVERLVGLSYQETGMQGAGYGRAEWMAEVRPLLRAAADRIEALTAERDELADCVVRQEDRIDEAVALLRAVAVLSAKNGSVYPPIGKVREARAFLARLDKEKER